MLALIAFSLQAAYAAHFGPTALRDPNVFVPNSSIPKWYAPHDAITHHLIWVGPPHGGAKPVADIGNSGESNLYGPLAGPLNSGYIPVSYTHLRAHETVLDLVCRLL